MNGNEFDVKANPPTTEELARKRQHYSDISKLMNCRERLFKNGCYAIGAIGFGVALVLWLMGDIAGVIAGAGAVAVVFAFTAAVTGIPVVAALLAGAAVAVVAGVLASAVALGVAGLVYDKWIRTPRALASESLAELVELEHSELPAECIAFVKWCEDDATLRSYQHGLVQLGRRPVRREYLAAKQWIETREMRKTEEQEQREAKQACERLDQVI